jgi:hypothetical protein
MDLYFFLDSHEFEPAITVSSFSPSGLLPDSLESDVFISIAYPNDGVWIIKTHTQVADYSSVSILASDLEIPREKVSSALVFLSSEKMDGEYSELPEVIGFNSRPSWRGNLRIIGKGTSVSYQGEMPYGMTKIKGGSIVSLIPFFQEGASIKNYLFFASFNSNPTEKKGTLELRDIQSKQILATFSLDSNKVNFLDLSDINFDSGQLLLVTKGIMGIPIFFSVDEQGKKMSLEHTMTPSEYSINGEQSVRRSIMQRMKSYWS